MNWSMIIIYASIALLATIIFLQMVRPCNCPREGWYRNQEKMNILGCDHYPDYFEAQYGEAGDDYPYRKGKRINIIF